VFAIPGNRRSEALAQTHPGLPREGGELRPIEGIAAVMPRPVRGISYRLRGAAAGPEGPGLRLSAFRKLE
jgi:hypothetical protein